MAGDNKRDRPLEPPSRNIPSRWNRNRPLPYNSPTTVDRLDTGEHIALVEIDWDTGTEYYSFTGIRSPSAYYDDLVVDVSPITRNVSLSGEAISNSTATVVLYNRSKAFSIKWATTGIYGRVFRVKFVSLQLGLASAITLFTGRITGYTLTNLQFTISGTDTQYSELFAGSVAQNVPLITTNNFPNLLDGQAPVMSPLIVGRFYPSAWPSNLGKVPCFLVDTGAGGGYPFVYIVAARPCITANTFALHYGGSVAVSGAYITAQPVYTGHTYAGITFQQEQRVASRLSEIEISAMLSGFTETDVVTDPPILNPVRAIEYLLETYTSITASNFDTVLQTAAKAVATAQGYDQDYNTHNLGNTESVPLAFWEADPARTWLNVLEDLCFSFGMALYMTRYGKLAVFVPTDGPEPATDFTVDDETDIVQGSFVVSSPTSSNSSISISPASILQYNHSFRWTYGSRGDLTPGFQSERNSDYTIPGEKTNIGGFDIKQVLDLKYNGSTRLACEVARVMAEYYKTGAQVIDFDLPIRWFRWADLNRYVGITHWQGPSAAGGYANVTARIVGIQITVKPTQAHIHLTCFKRAGNVIAADAFTRADSTSLGTGWTQSTVACTVSSNQLKFTGTSIAYGHALRTETYGNNQLARITSWLYGVATIGATIGIGVRMSGSLATSVSGYVFARVVTGGGPTYGWKLYKLVNANLSAVTGITLLGTVTVADFATNNAASQGCDFELRVEGTSLSVYAVSDTPARCGLILGPITDSAIATGTTGIACWGLGAGDIDFYGFFHANDF